MNILLVHLSKLSYNYSSLALGKETRREKMQVSDCPCLSFSRLAGSEWVNDWVSRWVCGWVCGWVGGWKREWVRSGWAEEGEWMRVWVNEESVSEWRSEGWMNKMIDMLVSSDGWVNGMVVVVVGEWMGGWVGGERAWHDLVPSTVQSVAKVLSSALIQEKLELIISRECQVGKTCIFRFCGYENGGRWGEEDLEPFVGRKYSHFSHYLSRGYENHWSRCGKLGDRTFVTDCNSTLSYPQPVFYYRVVRI